MKTFLSKHGLISSAILYNDWNTGVAGEEVYLVEKCHTSDQ